MISSEKLLSVCILIYLLVPFLQSSISKLIKQNVYVTIFASTLKKKGEGGGGRGAKIMI